MIDAADVHAMQKSQFHRAVAQGAVDHLITRWLMVELLVPVAAQVGWPGVRNTRRKLSHVFVEFGVTLVGARNETLRKGNESVPVGGHLLPPKW